MGAPARFTEGDVLRALKAAKKAAFTRVRISIDPLGSIVMDCGNDPMEDRSKVSALDRRMFGGR